MSLDDERLARVALSQLTEPADLRLSGLVTELGAVCVWEHLRAERDLRGMQTDIAARLGSIDPHRDLERAARRGIRYVIPGDPEWPVQLDDLATSVSPIEGRGGTPLGLWVRGPARLDALGRAVAVVGSRSCTTYGLDVAAEMAARMTLAGVWVVSGAAYGIDQAAHRGALAGTDEGHTVAVLAGGVDKAYPAAHRALIDHIAGVGAVVSEVAPGGATMRQRLLTRNRLIAALSRGTVVVEAAARSGARNTASWADGLRRQVMGVPGPVTEAASQGVHQMIREGMATLVTGADDVLELLGVAGEHLIEAPRGPRRARDRLTLRQQQVLDAVPLVRFAAVDSIARTAGIGLVEVSAALRSLHGHGLVSESSDGWRLTELART
ncbi:MAG: DNA-processing protein DprA [Nocardioidaceae bacterium]